MKQIRPNKRKKVIPPGWPSGFPAPRGVMRLTVRDIQKRFWRILRLVSRKGWIVEITYQMSEDPVAVLVPHGLYDTWRRFTKREAADETRKSDHWS